MLLQKLFKRVYSSDRGFTLIELLVVVSIIAILAAIAIPLFQHYRERSTKASMVVDARNAATQLEAYYVDNNSYLGANGDAAAAGGSWGIISGRTSTGNSGAITAAVTTWSVVITNTSGSTITLTKAGVCTPAGFIVAALNVGC